MTLRRSLLVHLATLVALFGAALPAFAAPNFIEFESGLVRPLALSADGGAALCREHSEQPPGDLLGERDRRAVRASRASRSAWSRSRSPCGSTGEVWVVNHLSDSLSIVDVANPSQPKVTRTLLVGDEPRDIVFAGNPSKRAFITTAHRGQQRTDAIDRRGAGRGRSRSSRPPASNRADVWVFDPRASAARFGGTPLRIVTLFGDTPRALAVSPDGNTVYAAVFYSGNQTTAVGEGDVCNGFTGAGACAATASPRPNGLAGGAVPGGLPGPNANVESITAPEVGLIVHFDQASGQWRDERPRTGATPSASTCPTGTSSRSTRTRSPRSRTSTHVGTSSSTWSRTR